MNADARREADPVPLSDREAVAAITARLRCRPEGSADEWVARDILATLKLLGYRKLLDLDVADWRDRPHHGDGPGLPTSPETIAELGKLKAAWAARATGPLPALREETETITEGKQP